MLGEKNSTLLRSCITDTKGNVDSSQREPEELSSALAAGDHTHHEEPVVAQRVAGNGGEVVVMAEDAAAIALPAPLAASQALVPGG